MGCLKNKGRLDMTEEKHYCKNCQHGYKEVGNQLCSQTPFTIHTKQPISGGCIKYKQKTRWYEKVLASILWKVTGMEGLSGMTSDQYDKEMERRRKEENDAKTHSDTNT